MNDRRKIVEKATQTIDDAFPKGTIDWTLDKILNENVRTNEFLERICKLLEEEDNG